LPADEAKRILQHVGVSTVADVDSVGDIVAVLRRVLRSWADGTLESLLPDPAACRAYSAERQTQTLVSALDGATASESFVPGKVAIPDSLQKEISRREEISKREATTISLQTYSSLSCRKDQSTVLAARSHNDLN
jgi:hypothetical protein